ncbi:MULTISPECIES: cytochrome P450 [Nostocales]|uniref:Cytochrome P450 n=3 Tax=Nostocales TaxID=1161 RepID=A0A8S9T2T7_9CYAN|nr:cytochrome P450 [Tolypothrix bouteillei]KAF3885892.1 cytochrome P450 [Tolypothrix bouteillei VB521301]
MQIPEVEKHPLSFHLIRMALDPLNHLDALSKRYGDIFTIMFGSTPAVFVSHPEGIKQIFTNTKDIKAPGELNRDMVLMTGQQGILQLDGSRHKHRRKLLMPAFHGARMQAYAQQICDLTEKAIAQYPIGKSFLAYPTIESITLQISMQVVLGLHKGERFTKLQHFLPAVLHHMRSPLMQICFGLPFLQKDLGHWSPWGYLLYLRQEIYQHLDAEVKERRCDASLQQEETDILSELISAHNEAGEPIANEEVRDLLLSPLFAAQDASGVAIAWLLYWIHRLPKVRDQLLKELDSLGECPDPMSIIELPYLSAVCQEALRIYPTQLFTFPRRVESPVELMGYELSPGTLLFGCIYLTHQREELYPQPKQFQPERFLERQFSTYEFLPFGGGVRSCIGATFALFEMKLVLATILSRYHLALVNKRPEQPRFEGLMCYPASGVKMKVLSQLQYQEKRIGTTTIPQEGQKCNALN